MAAPFNALSSDYYSIPKAQILFKPQGDEGFQLLGDADDVTVNIEVEETERFTNEEGIRQLAKTIVTQVDATLALTLAQLADVNRALSLLGEVEAVTQSSATSELVAITGVEAGKIYDLNHINITGGSVSVDDGEISPVAYTEGVDYQIDLETGRIQVLQIPGGAGLNMEVTYDAPAIVSGDGLVKIGIASKTENRGEVIIRGTNEVGPQLEVTLHDVQLRPSGERSYISETDLDTIEIEGRIFIDSTQPTGEELGVERLIQAI